MNRYRRRRYLALLAIPFLFAIVIAACGDDDDDDGEIGEVDVMGVWSDDEEESFRAMVAPWEEDTGGSLVYTGTRDLTQQVTVRVEGNNPPDVVIAPEVGVLAELVESGDVVPLSQCSGLEEFVEENYPGAFVELGSVDGEAYGIIMKIDNKGTIFYSPKFFEEMGWEPLTEDSTWDDLLALAGQIEADGVTPFSIGVESAEATGWVITDWVAQILLGQQGLDVYNGVIDGSIPFDDDRVKDAWQKFSEIVHTEGWVAQPVPDGVVSTGFIESTYPPFEDPPGAAMVYLGSFASDFIAEQFPELVPGEDYDFMPFPDGAITGAFNVAYALNDGDTACSFMRHLAEADTQQIWVERGGFNSAHKDIDLTVYTNPVGRKAAEGLLTAKVFAGDLDDLIGGSFQLAFFAAAVDFLEDPDDLDDLLTSLEEAR